MRRRRSHLHLKGASMAKRKKTIIAGQLVKTVIYTAPEPQDVPKVRAVKSRMTTAAQKAMNDKAARVRLEMLLAANFGPRDLFVTVTYRDKDLPAKRAGAVKNVRSFLKHLREHRRARGQTLKYIYTTEDKHSGGRLHHHLVINATGDDMETVRSLWPFGDDHTTMNSLHATSQRRASSSGLWAHRCGRQAETSKSLLCAANMLPTTPRSLYRSAVISSKKRSA